MNASEIRDIEERLSGSFTLPMSEEHFEVVVKRAKHERAVYIGGLLAAVARRIAQLVEGVRDVASSCTAARMRHS
jgi:hypothetical protein